MKVSVVIPAYNAGRYVRYALESVLAQGHADWECVCVDDGSSDSTGGILDDYAARDPRFRVIHQRNAGEGAARNAGMDAATGELLAFLDADDRMHPEALGVFVRAYERHGYDVLRFSPAVVDSPDAAFAVLPGEVVCEKVDFAACGESPFSFCRLGWATVFTREMSRKVRWNAFKQGADMTMVMDLLLLTRNTYRVDLPLVNYLIAPGSISRRLSLGLLKGTCDYIPAILDRADRLGVVSPAMDEACRYVADIVFRRLAGAWRKLPDPGERETARCAFWSLLGYLAQRRGFFTGFTCRVMPLIVRRRSLLLFRLLAALPYRLKRRFR